MEVNFLPNQGQDEHKNTNFPNCLQLFLHNIHRSHIYALRFVLEVTRAPFKSHKNNKKASRHQINI